MKGIILAGGTGSRLWPVSKSVNKHLLPIFDKPMIYYPLFTLMAAGIRQILLITNSHSISAYKSLLGDGSSYGVEIQYEKQDQASGIVDAFIIGKKFISNDHCALILGDNLFHGAKLGNFLSNHTNCDGASIFAYHVSDPKNYGVVEISSEGEVLSLEEKPNNPKSSYAIPGLYFYDNSVVDFAKQIKPSKRNELEITDLNLNYLHIKKLAVNVLQRGTVWMDMGTADNLFAASSFVKTIQERQGLLVSSIEEIAFRKGWIGSSKFLELASQYKNEYGRYLLKVIDKYEH
jgi:glucose-1-phosphate thymidylyltransferase